MESPGTTERLLNAMWTTSRWSAMRSADWKKHARSCSKSIFSSAKGVAHAWTPLNNTSRQWLGVACCYAGNPRPAYSDGLMTGFVPFTRDSEQIIEEVRGGSGRDYRRR